MKDYEKTYERKKKLGVNEVLQFIGKVERAELHGERIKLKSVRYHTFKNSVICCECGLVGSHFWMEKHRHAGKGQNGVPFHLNLYGITDGEEVMMTKDHIVPKSKGGSNGLKNMQTMCTVCNEKKGNRQDGQVPKVA